MPKYIITYTEIQDDGGFIETYTELDSIDEVKKWVNEHDYESYHLPYHIYEVSEIFIKKG